MSKKVCPICGGNLGFLKQTLKDDVKICSNCFNEAKVSMTEIIKRGSDDFTLEEIKERIKSPTKSNSTEKEIEKNDFKITKKIGNFVAFDEENKQWATLSTFRGKVKETYNYSDIVNFELIEDGSSVASGGLGRALVGGALFGGAGAIVGGVTGRKKTKGICNSLKLKVTVKDINKPVVYINFIETKTKKDGFVYKTIAEEAQQCLSTFQLICDRQDEEKTEVEVNNSSTSADDILKFKELLDAGAITEDEYEAKKKQLLGL